MTTVTHKHRNAMVTARSFLFGNDWPETGWGRTSGAVRKLPTRIRPLAERELAAALAGLLDDIDIGDVLVAGWRIHGTLQAAARATADDPSAVELVALINHHITADFHPHVDVQINGVPASTVRFDVDVTADVDNLVATVREARLVSLHSGRCVVRVVVSCAGHQLAERSAILDAPATVALGRGIALLST